MAGVPVRVWLALLTVFLSTGGVQAGSYCYQYRYSTYTYTYCDYGCCGHYGSQYCCDWEPTAALIVGCVFAGLFVVSIIVVVVCCCLKKKAHSGKVVSPSPGALQTRPGARPTPSSASAPPATVTTATTAAHYDPHTMAVFFPGAGVYHQPPPPGYTPHHLPPLSQPPTYQPPAPPPAYDMYGTEAALQQQQQQQQQGGASAGHSYGYGGVGAGTPTAATTSQAAPTTAYGNKFVV